MPAPHPVRRLQSQLEIGSGPVLLEIFLEPTCPYCERAFGKLSELLDRAGPGRLSVRLWLHSQPWHLFSPVVTRCIVAAGLAETQMERPALEALRAVYDHRAAFVAERHAVGPRLGLSPADVVTAISELTGIDLAEPFALDEATTVMSWHARYARQNGIHVSPTFVIDGLVSASMGSGQSVEEWLAELGLSDHACPDH